MKTNLETYKGCGKAWAAVKQIDGEWVAVDLIYMNRFSFDPSTLTPEQLAVYNSKAFSMGRYAAPVHLGAMRAALEAVGVKTYGPRGGRINSTTLLNKYTAEIEEEESRQFGEYRAQSRAALAEKGEVVSGECSCTMFYTNDDLFLMEIQHLAGAMTA